MSPTTGWFCTLLDSAPDVYFRYATAPGRRLVYLSPSVETLTGMAPAKFYANPGLCGTIVASGEGRLLRRIVRARRSTSVTVHITREGVSMPVEIRIVPVIVRGRIVAIEGVARLAVGADRERASSAAPEPEPVQQRLAALMFEVHGLLHRVLPATAPKPSAGTLQFGALTLDPERLTVTDAGQPVSLTTREVMVLRYLLERPGRVVTREQLLTNVWAYNYTGDDRTVDVHVSRLRRKLPSLRGRLTAIRHIGYRLDEADTQPQRDAERVANC